VRGYDAAKDDKVQYQERVKLLAQEAYAYYSKMHISPDGDEIVDFVAGVVEDDSGYMDEDGRDYIARILGIGIHDDDTLEEVDEAGLFKPATPEQIRNRPDPYGKRRFKVGEIVRSLAHFGAKAMVIGYEPEGKYKIEFTDKYLDGGINSNMDDDDLEPIKTRVRRVREAGLFKPATPEQVRQREEPPLKVTKLIYPDHSTPRDIDVIISFPLEIEGIIRDYWNDYRKYMGAYVENGETWSYVSDLVGRKLQVGKKIITVPYDSRR
jgi:hypothetical protein